MRRPSLALLALLVSLAMGLAAISPRRAEATTLGELFCAIEIITPPYDAVDGDYCPDCPFADECPHVCTPPGVPQSTDDYNSAPVAPAANEPAATVDASAQVELNAAATSNEPDDTSAWENEYGRYYGDFYSSDEQYADEYANEYEDSSAEVVAEEVTEPFVVEESAAEDVDFRYGEGYDPWTPVVQETVNAPSPEDLIVEPTETEAVEASPTEEPYDLYGRQQGDEYYGYDFEEAEPAASDYESAYEYEYNYNEEYDYEYNDGSETEAPTDSPAVSENVEAEATVESYYEDYYPDYYAELYGNDEAAAANEAEPVEPTEANSDSSTGNDAAYDEAIYREQFPAAESASEVPADAILDELVDPAPTADADAECDLPWADEVPAVEETADGESATAADEVAERPALQSEYGSDYADDYYRALFDEEAEEDLYDSWDTEEAETAEPAFDEAYDFFHSPCGGDECCHPRASSVTQLVVHYGRQVVALTESLELVSMRLHSACLQLAELPSQMETK